MQPLPIRTVRKGRDILVRGTGHPPSEIRTLATRATWPGGAVIYVNIRLCAAAGDALSVPTTGVSQQEIKISVGEADLLDLSLVALLSCDLMPEQPTEEDLKPRPVYRFPKR